MALFLGARLARARARSRPGPLVINPGAGPPRARCAARAKDFTPHAQEEGSAPGERGRPPTRAPDARSPASGWPGLGSAGSFARQEPSVTQSARLGPRRRLVVHYMGRRVAREETRIPLFKFTANLARSAAALLLLRLGRLVRRDPIWLALDFRRIGRRAREGAAGMSFISIGAGDHN